ncbi:ATP-binding protein [Colwellia sp. 6_MG-2023]|jgi:two-component system sensor histidine kinase RegB|uniref:sensor histidine kinase n=2 Tax=Colwellia TaxID=28228 RepID=UPI0026E1FD5B|nr:ATP-binding protein [Colwellia sp. 6_MG-2023]MBU2925397.1 sensor histidine kinase [Colwellia sp. C2M11]MDO6489483.1 ATP-binding protein [Colwellia sp. 6_MG-2023]MDO6653473.1 ATP-binding protein [Colwellia sp. 3_MG-2023]MDO6666269.1 ATP-binding protein [Colwellia sp. 2_MG-2023]
MFPFFKIASFSTTLKSGNPMQMVLALRSVAIVIQLLLILFVNLVLNYQLPWAPLFGVIALELIYTFISFVFYQKKLQVSQLALLIQICSDIVFMSLLLFFSGGATNAFVSLLLIPIAIAAVTLPPTLLALVAFLAIGSYSILLWFLPMSVMHGNMEGHFIAMGINFLFSTLVVALVVGKMARSINQRELAIAAYREDLLKQEQVTSLGVASAQVTHQLATPIATIQLLVDELEEDFTDNSIIVDMQSQLKRCSVSLDAFRSMVLSIKEQTRTVSTVDNLLNEILENLRVNYPDIDVRLLKEHQVDVTIMADATLLPAILNLINNAIQATKANSNQEITLTSQVKKGCWQFIIRDNGPGFTLEKLEELGMKPVSSEQGLGMAVFLSHATLERLGGKLLLTNHHQGGALVTLTLPVQ